jgi:exonuclease SbcC
MITRIELTNFMSHAHTVIEPAPGLTVLVGPNNCGKSAVVAALQIICQNANSTYVRRHETSECVVQVHTDDGHVVRWSRKKSGSPKYLIDGQPFDRLGIGGVPDELHAVLRLPRVDGGDESDFDVHFGAQKSPIFLIGSSPANAARFFASSSDAIRLVQMQKRHKEKLAERQREKVRLEAESKQLNAELESLQPVAELERGIAQAEHRHEELQRLVEQIESTFRDRQALQSQLEAAQRQATRAAALQSLKSPPELAPTEPLAKVAGDLRMAVQAHQRAVAVQQSVERLPAPPELADTAWLAKAVADLLDLQRTSARGHASSEALRSFASPPDLAETQTLAALLQELFKTQEHFAECRARCGSLTTISIVPQFADEQELAIVHRALAAATTQVGECRNAANALQSLHEAPASSDVVPLRDLLRDVEGATTRFSECQSAFNTAAKQLAAAAAELRELAESSLCPTCGAPLDADRLLAAAGAGPGGHHHG